MPILLLLACVSRDRLTVYVDPGDEDVIRASLGTVPWDDVEVVVSEDPGAAARGRGTTIAIQRDDGECDECYAIDGGDRRWDVRGGGVLGVQYGLSEVLEALGFGFWHPYRYLAPEHLGDVDGDGDDVDGEYAPEIGRRGIHLHTLHPIEGLSAFWLDNDGTEAADVVDWVVKNRGNHVQWAALDDVLDDAGRADDWRDDTTRIVDDAHARGLTVGVGLELFGSANLQHSFDLVDEAGTPEQEQAAIDERLHVLCDGVPWDVLNLSFGEFFGEDPQTFIDTTDLAYQRIEDVCGPVDVPVTIHVNNAADARVDWDGKNIPYYFLVQYADPGLRPWIHTTMYYNLYDPTNGAYWYDDFSEQRGYLLDRLRAGQPVGYFPEDAYWVAFDDSVPQYFPVYVESRWMDLAKVREQTTSEGVAPLDDHVLFSSGWEWGYWQNDALGMRMSYRLPDDAKDAWTGLFRRQESGVDVAAVVDDVANQQRQALILDGLAPYLAGRDSIIDFGYAQGIRSQPDRPQFEDVAAYDDAAKTSFRTDVVDPLRTYQATLEDDRAGLPTVDGPFARWVAEIDDGLQVDALRARFAADVWAAALGDDTLGDARAALDEAGTVVARRKADFDDADGTRWTAEDWDNPTVYDYGYLIRADELCYWQRELVQVTNLVDGKDDVVPGCAL